MSDADTMLAEVLDGDADAATRGLLAELMRRDATVRERFLGQVAIAGALRSRHQPAQRLAALRERTLATLVDGGSLARTRRRVLERLPPRPEPRRRRWWWWIPLGLCVAAAAVVLVLRNPTSPLQPNDTSLHTPPWNGTGSGLRGDYYGDHIFTRLAGSRVDPQIHFDWPGSPIDTMPADHFTVRWSGKVQPRVSGTYTFIIRADDRVRLWIAGRLLIDTWDRPDISDQYGEITLEGRQRYALQIEYCDNEHAGEIAWWWQAAGQAKEIVPTSQLYPP